MTVVVGYLILLVGVAIGWLLCALLTPKEPR